MSFTSSKWSVISSLDDSLQAMNSVAGPESGRRAQRTISADSFRSMEIAHVLLDPAKQSV
jgi:hypothetical protein